MPPRTPTPLIKVDVKKKAEEQTPVPHNRWHPDIPAVGAAHHALPAGCENLMQLLCTLQQ